ncbi:hypothetical protein ACE6H2_010832 [Prunus campanulata]
MSECDGYFVKFAPSSWTSAQAIVLQVGYWPGLVLFYGPIKRPLLFFLLCIYRSWLVQATPTQAREKDRVLG